MTKSFSIAVQRILVILVLSVIQVMLWSQDTAKSSSVTITKKSTSSTTEWYTQPWVWVVGGAVFLIILIALLRGGSSDRSKEVSRTTVIKD